MRFRRTLSETMTVSFSSILQTISKKSTSIHILAVLNTECSLTHHIYPFYFRLSWLYFLTCFSFTSISFLYLRISNLSRWENTSCLRKWPHLSIFMISLGNLSLCLIIWTGNVKIFKFCYKTKSSSHLPA